jgi:hypothetical protein
VTVACSTGNLHHKIVRNNCTASREDTHTTVCCQLKERQCRQGRKIGYGTEQEKRAAVENITCKMFPARNDS